MCAARNAKRVNLVAPPLRHGSAALGVQCRLVRYHGGGCDEQQDVAAATASDKDAEGGVAFANEAPLLLVQQSAVDALNHSLRAGGEPHVSARHFRPNLVVDGGSDQPWSVHATTAAKPRSIGLAGGQLELTVLGPCARCAMVEVDPTSGQRHGAVLRALAKHHRVRSRLLGFFKPAVREKAGDALVEVREESSLEFL